MKSTQGIAIVTTLLVGASVLILSLGTMFLTRADLSIGDNVRANTLAKYRAQVVFESSLIALQHEADANGTLPQTFTAPRLTLVGDDAVDSAESLVYTQLSPEQAVLKANGVGPREASFVSEGVLELGSMSQVTEPVGLSAGGSMNVGAWAGTRITDAHIHGNAGYSFSDLDLSKLGACSSRDLAGLCAIWLPYDMSVDADGDGVADNLNVTAAADLPSYVCAPAGDADLCELVDGSPAPRQRIEALSLELDTDALLAAQVGACDQSYSTPPSLNSQADVDVTFKSGQTVCISGDLTLPSGAVLDGVRIIAEDGDVKISGGSVVNSSIVSKNGRLNLSTVSVDSSFLYSKTHLSLPASVTLQGQTEVISGATLDFAAVSPPISTSDGPAISVRVYAQDNLRYAPSNDTFAYFATGASFEVGSGACILGSVEAALDINAAQGVCIDAGLAQGDAAPVDTSVRVVSRR